MKKRALLLILIILLLPVVFSSKTGEMKLLAVSNVDTNPEGSVATLKLEIEEGSGRVFMDSFPLSKIDTQISTRFAKEVACNFLEADCSNYDFFYTIRANSALIGGPSAGAAITILTISVLEDLPIDAHTSITGTINTGGIIGPVGSVAAKAQSAANAGVRQVLIPRYTVVNMSNFTGYEDEYGVEVVEVSHISEALYYFTGVDYTNYEEVNISESYIDTMGQISIELCDRAEELSKVYDVDENVSALNLLKKGKLAVESNQHYSAASFCFGSGLNSRNRMILDQKLTNNQIGLKINETRMYANDLLVSAKTWPLKTLTDLETYMAVTDRIFEAKDRLDTSEEFLFSNESNINASIFQLAYATERLYSAKSWSVFFGTEGRQFNFDKKALDESCLKKISEVEERIQYVNLILPTDTDDSRDSIRKAYKDYNSGNPELCLYKASIAKARIDLLLNSISIDPEYTDEVIEDRLKIVKALIAKQNQKGIFPIVAYSYYEYANSLKETDKFSALLYAGYALELANLDIYFEKKKIDFPKISSDQIWFFVTGSMVGFSLSTLLFKLSINNNKKSKKPKKKR